MKWQLATSTEEAPFKRRYSELERQLFKLIPANARISIHSLVIKRKDAGKWKAKYQRSVISTTMLRLIGKVIANKEAFIIKKTTGPRHQPVYYWIEAAPKQKATSRHIRDGSTKSPLLD